MPKTIKLSMTGTKASRRLARLEAKARAERRREEAVTAAATTAATASADTTFVVKSAEPMPEAETVTKTTEEVVAATDCVDSTLFEYHTDMENDVLYEQLQNVGDWAADSCLGLDGTCDTCPPKGPSCGTDDSPYKTPKRYVVVGAKGCRTISREHLIERYQVAKAMERYYWNTLNAMRKSWNVHQYRDGTGKSLSQKEFYALFPKICRMHQRSKKAVESMDAETWSNGQHGTLGRWRCAQSV